MMKHKTVLILLLFISVHLLGWGVDLVDFLIGPRVVVLLFGIGSFFAFTDVMKRIGRFDELEKEDFVGLYQMHREHEINGNMNARNQKFVHCDTFV